MTAHFVEADTQDPDDLRTAIEEGHARYDREMAAAEKEKSEIKEEEKSFWRKVLISCRQHRDLPMIFQQPEIKARAETAERPIQEMTAILPFMELLP